MVVNLAERDVKTSEVITIKRRREHQYRKLCKLFMTNFHCNKHDL